MNPKSFSHSVAPVVTDCLSTSIIANTVSSVILSSNKNRKFICLRNDSNSTAFIELGLNNPVATTFSVYVLFPDGFMSVDNFTGSVAAIWLEANGYMHISEGI